MRRLGSVRLVFRPERPRVRLFYSFCALLLPTALCSAAALPPGSNTHSDRTPSTSIASLPIGFEQNLGQADPGIRFLARANGYVLDLGKGEFVIELANKTNPKLSELIRITLVGADPSVEVQGLDPLAGVTHYYLGSDPKAWITNVRRSGKVRYQNIYPGVDLIFYGVGNRIEFDFAATPGTAVSQIRLRVDGATVRKSKRDVKLVTPRGEVVVLQSPNLYQVRGNKRYSVTGGYSIKDRREITLMARNYDRKLPLLIDPGLVYSTGFTDLIQSTILAGQYPSGQYELDEIYGITTDSAGAAYVTGSAAIADPSQALQPEPSLWIAPAFVVKLDPTGSNLRFSAYLGNKNSSATSQSTGRAIAVDPEGNVYIAGDTTAPDFPTTSNAFSTAPVCPNGGSGGNTSWSCDEPFAAKLDPTGKLVYSTFLVQGPPTDSAGPVAASVAVDANGALYVGGNTLGPASFGLPAPLPPTPKLPTTAGALQTVRKNDSTVFVLKLHPDGSKLDYSTYLGGSISESFGGVAVDSTGIAYVGGGTASADFPTTSGAFQQTNPGQSAFFTKLGADGSSLVYSTFLGATGITAKAAGLALDGNSAAYLTGEASGPGFPTTAGAFRTNVPPPASIYGAVFPYNFVSKFDSANNLSYSTYIGYGMSATETDRGEAIAVDGEGSAYVAGATRASDYPSVGSLQPFPPISDSFSGVAFVTKLNPQGSALDYSTFILYPALAESGVYFIPTMSGIAVDANHNAYFAGWNGYAIPTTAGAFQPIGNGTTNGFVIKIADMLGAPVPVLIPRQLAIPSTWQKGTTSVPSIITLANYGDQTLSINGISISGADAGDFAQSNNCGASVATGANCTLQITFSPTVDVGTRNALLVFDFGALPGQSVPLSGQAGFPIIQITPALSWDFGAIGVGTFDTEDFQIANTGTGVLHLGYAFTGDYSGDMFGGFLGILPPGSASPPLRVSFKPTAAGVRTGQLIITDDAAGSPHIVQFTGTGIAVNAGDFTLIPSGGLSSSTITSGQTATYRLLAVPGSGFTDTISLSCSGVPEASNCAVNPSNFQLGLTTFTGTTPQPVTVSISTTRASSAANVTAPPWYALVAVPAMLLSIRTRSRELSRSFLLVVLMVSSLLVTSCGGGSTSPPQRGTPPGTYTLTVTAKATSSDVAHSALLTLIVH
jgi:hypothetical protein